MIGVKWLMGLFGGIGVKKMLSRAMIFAVLVLGACTIGLYFKTQFQQNALDGFWQRIERVEDQNKELQQANDELDGTVAQLTEQRERDSNAISGLIDRMKQLDTQDDETRTRLEELEKNNAETRAYLDSLVDPAVSCLLDPACKGDGDSKGSGGDLRGAASPVDAALRTTEPKAPDHEPRPREWVYRMAFRRYEM